MGYKLDFVWLSDPLLQYALYLSAIFIMGIVACMILIAHKFQSHHSHQVKQAHAIDLINNLLNANQPIQSQIDALNQCICKHPIDACYAVVRVLENASVRINLNTFKPVQVKVAIDQSLRSFFRKNRAIAIEAIGFLHYDCYRPTIICYLKDPQYCSFAAEALVRLDGISAIPIILDYYRQQTLTISQTLTALVQLAPHDLKHLLLAKDESALPTELMCYLKLP